MSTGRTHHWVVTVGFALTVVAMLSFTASPSLASPVTAGLGTGIFSFSGSADFAISLLDAGNYYLAAASDGGVIDVQVEHNGTLVADTNTTTSRADLVTLLGGNYTIHATGTGRAALGIDFTSPANQAFPVLDRIGALVSPPPTVMVIHLLIGNASAVRLGIYDDALHVVWNGSLSASGDVQVNFGILQAFSFLVIGSDGPSGGAFALSWGAAPPPDLTPLYVGSVAVPVAVAAVVLLVLRYRRRRPPLRAA